MAQTRYIVAGLVLLYITCVYGHIAMSSPTPIIPNFNAAGYCGNSPTNLPPYGTDTSGANVIHTVVAGTNFTFSYELAHNFDSLQSAHLIKSSDYTSFGISSTKIADGVAYNSNIQNTLSLTLPLDEIPVAVISVFSNALGYGECADFNIRCPIGMEGANCANYNNTALQYLAGLQKTDPTAYQNAIAELNDPNLAQIKTNVLAQIYAINNPSGSGAAIGISLFVIALVGIIAGTLYYRHRNPEGFASKVSATKYHLGNGWDYVKSKFNRSSSGSSLPVTKPTTSPVATTTAVAVQPTIARPTPPKPVPSNVSRPTPPPSNVNRPTPPPKKTLENINRSTPPPKQGGVKAPLPPSEEVKYTSEYKYTPPVKELPSLPDKPTPPPKRTY